MKRVFPLFATLLITISLAMVLPLLAQATTYTFTTIDVPGASNTYARGINNSGHIVGSYDDHGFLDVGGGFTTINFPGASGTRSSGINNSDDIVGFYAMWPYPQDHGFIDVGGSFTSINLPAPTFTTFASGINDSGNIVGGYAEPKGYHGFLDVGGVFTPIDVPGASTLVGDSYTIASGINNS